ncbi:MAG: ABC transporter ATP-binding protein [Bacilli bacterium]|nr:ABC transporter ATP-binding protein [Bacilli bacterium]
MKNIVEVKELTKEYKGIKAVDNLSLEVKEGEILGLLGPNGSGKTTTINCILSLLNYQKGSIKIFDKEMNPDSYDVKREIGVIFQEVAVFEELTVYDNIDYFCGLYIKEKETRKKYIEEALKLVEIEKYKKFYPKELSGGLLRRLNIACGIAHKPKLIFLDEPTVAVDPQSRNNILEGIEKLRKEGATIIYTTHYMEEVEILCDRIIILDKGKILAQGTSDDLKVLANIDEKITVETEEIEEKIIDKIKSNKNIDEVILNKGTLIVTYKKGQNNLGELIDCLKENKVKYTKIYSEKPTLNDVFLNLTGKELRDNV